MPIIPFLGSLLSITGVATLVWYYSKSVEERNLLDGKASKLARDWYDLNVDQLNVKQFQRIYDEVRKIG